MFEARSRLLNLLPFIRIVSIVTSAEGPSPKRRILGILSRIGQAASVFRADGDVFLDRELQDALVMTKRYLVTAALPDSNGRLHVGHMAGAYIPADIYVRYLRAAGNDVRFISGSDDNGGAIEISAFRENVTGRNRQQVSRISGRIVSRIGISFDVYGGTHTPGFIERHNQLSQNFLKIYEKGYFTKREVEQLFDPKGRKIFA